MRFLLTLFLLCSLARMSPGHPVSISSTIADVRADRIDVDIEVMLEDLVLYHQLTADAENKYPASDLKAAAEKHRQFLLDGFSILDGDGQALGGTVETVTTEQIDAAAIGQSELMRRTINFKLVYPLANKPKFLTFRQTFGGPRATLPAVMDLHILREGSFGEPGMQMAHGRPHTVQLDWSERTPGTKLSLVELRKQHKAQLQERLGIASYTGLFSFLYINRFEVRHEVLIPLLTLDQWIPIPRQDKDFIEVDEQQSAIAAIETFLKQKQQVTIDGQQIQPKLVRVNFFGLDINDFALNAEPRRMSVVQARVGVIVSFPAPAAPHQVDVKWNAYSEYASLVNSVVLIGDQAPTHHTFQALDNTYRWTGDLVDVNIQPVSVAGEIKNDAESQQAVEKLLGNIYRAFDLREDEQVYDALAHSVDGPLLRDIYLQIKRSLIMAEQGGSIAHVQAVKVEQLQSAKASDANTFEVTWLATGVTEHWGHVHTRTSQYRGRLSLAQADGHWKLSKFQLLDEKRIKFETSIRGYDPNP